MKVRIVYRADGGVTVIHPAPKSRRKDETEAEWLERVFSKTQAPQYNEHEDQVNQLYACDYDDVDKRKIPLNRKYRDAWIGSKGQGISIDSVKSAEIDVKLAKPTDKEKIGLLEARLEALESNNLKKRSK